mgnify:CR=1 FL=1
MIVANFYHLKNTNGLFYYGVDYLSENVASVRRVLVRPSMYEATKRAFPKIEIVPCTFPQLCLEVMRAARRKDFVYTPSSHPLPFVSRQMIVVHDIYPFFGAKGKIKELLLRLSLATSTCRAGYINHSDARGFVGKLGVGNKRALFAPNKFPSSSAVEPRKKQRGNPLAVGLFGTDSAKKNYAELFAQLRLSRGAEQVRFFVYGHRTDYYEQLIAQFPDIALELVESDKCSLSAFMAQVDMIVSVADHEGFGRPIASALLAHVPCLLVQRPVFVEFFQGGAQFGADIPDVVRRLLATAAAPMVEAVSYSPPATAVDGYHDAVAYLKAEAVAV